MLCKNCNKEIIRKHIRGPYFVFCSYICGRRYSANESYSRNSEWLKEQKDKPCLDCGLKFPPCCMDFDHRPGEIQSFKVGRGVQRKRADILKEIEKCDLVCANCHRIRTYTRITRTRSI